MGFQQKRASLYKPLRNLPPEGKLAQKKVRLTLEEEILLPLAFHIVMEFLRKYTDTLNCTPDASLVILLPPAMQQKERVTLTATMIFYAAYLAINENTIPEKAEYWELEAKYYRSLLLAINAGINYASLLFPRHTSLSEAYFKLTGEFLNLSDGCLMHWANINNLKVPAKVRNSLSVIRQTSFQKKGGGHFFINKTTG